MTSHERSNVVDLGLEKYDLFKTVKELMILSMIMVKLR